MSASPKSSLVGCHPLWREPQFLALWYGAMAAFQNPGIHFAARLTKCWRRLWHERASLFPAAWRTGGVALAGFTGGRARRRRPVQLRFWPVRGGSKPRCIRGCFRRANGAGRGHGAASSSSGGARATPSILAISFVISFFPIVASTTLGHLVSTDRGLLELFTVLQATKAQEIFQLQPCPLRCLHFPTGVKIAATLAPIGGHLRRISLPAPRRTKPRLSAAGLPQ